MIVTWQNINDIRITIRDCRICNTWGRIAPVLNKLYEACEKYNRDSHNVFMSIEQDENASHEINSAKFHEQIANAQRLINKLRGMGVHFVDLHSFDLFSRAFCQAMTIEFGE